MKTKFRKSILILAVLITAMLLFAMAPMATPVMAATNASPVVEAGANATINAGGTFASNGSFTDMDSTAWTATVDYGDGSGSTVLTLNSDKTFSLNHVYTTVGSYTVKVTVTDDAGAAGSDTATVTVNEPAPTISTDKRDYYPGETVNITGSGFQAGETVHLSALGSPNGISLQCDTVTGTDGTINASLQIPLAPPQDDTYVLTATGLSSGLTAQMTFTDTIHASAVASSNSSGTPKASFLSTDNVYAHITTYGGGSGDTVRLYVVNVSPSDNGSLTDVSGGYETYTIHGNDTVNVWSNPTTVGTYYIVLDSNANGIYNSSGDFVSGSFNITSPPTAAITYSIPGPYKSGTTVTITATFNVPMADSPVTKIAISGANTLTATNMTKSSSTVYTYAYTVGAGNGTATVALSIGTDLAGNVVTSTPTSGATFTVDNTTPTAAITYSVVGPYKSGTLVTITAAFSEAMADSPVPKIAISGVTGSNLPATNMSKTDSTHYYYAYTVGTGDGTATVSLSTGTDIAGNLVTSAPTSGATFTVDNTAPTNQNTVFAASVIKQGGASVTIVSSGDATNNVWFAPSGTTTFAAGATMTKAASGTATTILAPTAAGTYYCYVIDAAGNISNASTATLTVDNTAPTAAITYSVASPYKSGTVVTITATFNEAMADSPVPQVAITGANTLTATNMTKSSSTVYTYAYTVGAGNGTATVSLSTGTDIAGNVVASSPTSGATFTVDNTAPTLSSVSIASNNANTARAKVGDVVTLNFTSSENIQTPTVTIAGHTATIGGSNPNWSATWTMASGDTEGVVPFNITFSDVAGNAGIAVTSTTNSSSVTFDKTAPASSITFPANGGSYNTSTWITISGSASDTGSGVNKVEVSIKDTTTGLWWQPGWTATSVTWVLAASTTSWTYTLSPSNLTIGHGYLVQSRATDNAGNVETPGTGNSFTYVGAPSIDSGSVGTNITDVSATCAGNITSTNGATVTSRGIFYGTTTSYGSTKSENGSFGTGVFTENLTGLLPGTLYHFQAFATNSAGTGTGFDSKFLTLPDAPTNFTVTGETTTSVSLSWTNGTGADTTIVRYKTGSYPTSPTDGNSGYSGNGTSCTISSLSPSVIYYFAAWSSKTVDIRTQTSSASVQVSQATLDTLELTAPSNINLGSLVVGSNGPFTVPAGSVSTSDPNGVIVKVQSNNSNGKMTNGTYTLGNPISITTGTLANATVTTTSATCLTLNAPTAGTSIPLSVSQTIAYTDPAVTGYSIILTYTATLNQW